MLTTWQFILIVVGVLMLGALLFFLTGFIRVYKGRIAIIERVGLFVGIYKSGIYYFTPIIYRRVGMYRLGEIKEVYPINKDEYQITYEIVDVKKYHYEGHHDIEGVLKASLIDSRDNLSETLIKRCENIGVKFITLEKIKKSQ